MVSNSTSLIALNAIGSRALLTSLYGSIHIPEAVYNEVVSGAGRAGASAVASAKWITRHTVVDQPAITSLKINNHLATGESEAIVLAGEMGADLILLDDRAARRVARQHNLSIIGTVGILLQAKDQQMIPAVKPLLDSLISAGIYLDATLYQQALRLAGE